MAQPLEAPCPVLVLNNGCRVVLEARSATDGSAVTGVTVSDVAIYGVDLGSSSQTLLDYPLAYVPTGNTVTT